MARTPFAADDVTRLTDIVDVQAAPDGSGRVAVATSRPDLDTNAYERTVAVVDIEGATEPVTHPGRMPRWSPTGALTLVRDDADGSHVVLADDGTTLCTSPDPIEELAWSPDGQWLLYVARTPVDRDWWQTPVERRPPLRITRLRFQEDNLGFTVGRPRQAFLVPSAGGTPRLLSSGGHDDAEFSWHPDSRSVVFVSQRHEGLDRTLLNDIFVQDVDGSEARQLTATQYCFGRPLVAPDATTVAFASIDVLAFPDNVELGTMPIGGGTPTVLTTALDRDCTLLGWHGDGALTALVDDAGAVHCYEVPVDGSAPALLLGGPRRVGPLVRDGDTFTHVLVTGTEPPRLVVSTQDGAERTALAPNAAFADAHAPRPSTHRRIDTAPGVTVDSWLTLPDPDVVAAPYPLLVCLQGGGTQYGHQWTHEFQLLAGAGFATLQLNARGSAGYGRGWARAVSGPHANPPGDGWGTVDVDDVAAVVTDTLRATPQLDPARVGVQGGSYGALVTTWLLARTDLFAAGWAERGPYNVHSLAGTNDEMPWFGDTYLGRSQIDDPGAYWTPSPLRVAPQITAPLAIVHSEHDRRCPIQQAEELFTALKVAGRDVELIRFPGESHELTRSGSPVHRVQRLEILLDWFTRRLAP